MRRGEEMGKKEFWCGREQMEMMKNSIQQGEIMII
jgi:hypothetical protein